MSRSALILALVAIIACTAVQGQYVQTQIFTGDYAQYCNGTAYQTSNGTTLGSCQFGPVSPVSGQPSAVWATYINGAFSYSYSYDASFTTNCSDATITSISEIAFVTTCVLVDGSDSIYQLSTILGGASPALPLGSFPPTGFYYSTLYWNTTSKAASTVCATGSDVIVKSRTAAPTGVCTARTGAGLTPNTYEASYCTSDALKGGNAVFSAAGCAASTLLDAHVSDLYCQDGKMPTCGTAATFPALPNTGATFYSNADCTSVHPDMEYKKADACIDRQIFTCGSTNSTTDVVFTKYANDACTGTATTTWTFKSGVCSAYGTSGDYIIASCDLVPGGSSASTASVSMIAMVVASLVAIFARSL